MDANDKSHKKRSKSSTSLHSHQQDHSKNLEFYKDIFDNLVDEVHVWRLIRDENGEIITWKLVDVNQSALKSWNKKKEDVIGKTTNEIFDNYDVTKQFLPMIQKLFKDNKSVAWESFFPPTNQYLSMISIPYGDGFISTGRNISHLIRTQKALEFKNKEMQSIIFIASHDLRSPLVNIQGFGSILKTSCDELTELLIKQREGADNSGQIEKLIKNEIPEALDFICSSSEKMSNLLDGLLQVSRLGTAKVNIESLDVNSIVMGVLKSLEFQIHENNITVSLETLPDCKGDTHMLDHIFTNLISNAIKYRDPDKDGEIKISGKVQDGMSIYCVEDNGMGIEPAHQKKVFEMFHRLNPQGPVSGEGLGLTIVTRILDRLDGKIWLESQPGVGSKFFVALPTAN